MQTISFATLCITPSSNTMPWHSYLCSYVYRELKLTKTRHAYVFMYDTYMWKTYLTFCDAISGETRNAI